MRLIFLIIFIFCFKTENLGQGSKKVNLYYYGDSVLNVSCGVFKGSRVLLFSKKNLDTIKNFNNNQIGIIVDCPEQYGVGFFKHRSLYEIVITKAASKDYEFCKESYKEFRRKKIKVYKLKSINKK